MSEEMVSVYILRQLVDVTYVKYVNIIITWKDEKERKKSHSKVDNGLCALNV